MKKYILTDVEKNMYIVTLPNGSYTLSDTPENVVYFKNRDTASKFVLNSQNKNMRNYHWTVKEVDEPDEDTSSTVSVEFLEKVKKIKNRLISENGYEDNLCKTIGDFLDEIVRLVEMKPKVVESISKLDKTMIDTYHCVEMMDDFDEKLCQEITQLQNKILVNRRKYKNKLNIIQKLESMDLDFFDKFSLMVEKMNNPIYHFKSEFMDKDEVIGKINN